jgi:FAD/FMN-containing dehydrogenase
VTQQSILHPGISSSVQGSLSILRSALRGPLFLPGDAGYEEARRVWNGMIDRRPALIVRPADAGDVATAVNYARDHALALAVRGGGHNVAGFGTCDGGLVIDLSLLNEIEVNAAASTARVQGGATWGQLDAAAQAGGLATTGGLVSTTGVGGLTLGGGIGWLMRKHGLACDNLLSADLVTVDGRQMTASATEHPDLFWGLRGGGGNFGVVTSFKFRLHPVGPIVLGGALFYPVEQAPELLRFYREWARDLPDDLTTLVAFLTAPPEPFVPEQLRGTPMIAIAMCYSGPIQAGQQLVQPLRQFVEPAIDLVGPLPYVALQGMFDESAPHGIHAYWKTAYLRNLDDGTIDVVLDHVSRMRNLSPFSVVHVHQVGGVVSRMRKDETPFAGRDAPYILNIVGLWMAHEDPAPHIAWARAFAEGIKLCSMGGEYVNFQADQGADRVKAAYGAGIYDRLAEVKRKYDPDNLFRINQNILPAA